MIRTIALSIAATAILMTGCATGLSPAGVGIVTDVKGPITATNLKATKVGTACAKTIVGVLVKGDASIRAAKKAGKISKVSTVDYHTKGYYPFVGETCIIVTGQ